MNRLAGRVAVITGGLVLLASPAYGLLAGDSAQPAPASPPVVRATSVASTPPSRPRREGTPYVSCAWSQVRGVAQYRLWREHDGTRGVVATVGPDVTQHIDRAVALGVTYQYLVEAVDRSGRVVAHSPVLRVVCCEPARAPRQYGAADEL